MWQYQNTDELYHHGILGQRWGIRRYQNPDGTLTSAGRKKANKLAKKYAKVTGNKLVIKNKSILGNENKSINEMSYNELKQKIDRMHLEDDLNRMIAARAPKQQISRGKKFINNIKRNVISPALTDAGRTLLTNFIKKKGNDLIYGNDKNKVDSNKTYKDKIADIELKAREVKAKNSLNYENFIYDYFEKNKEPYSNNKNKNKNRK